MRSQVEVLWLEDKPEFDHKERQDMVRYLLGNKGYLCNFHDCNTFDKAIDMMNNKTVRIDFFISDYDLGNDKNGIDYLELVRNQLQYKEFFILYSRTNLETIKQKVIESINQNKINLISNFTFISLASKNLETEFRDAIDIGLSRWDELNALRGMFMCENALIEECLKKELEHTNPDINNSVYKQCFNTYKYNRLTQNSRSKNKDLLEQWSQMIDKRNALAHVKEKKDNKNGFYIESEIDTTITIHEKDIDSERKKLIELVERIKKLLGNPN